MSIFAENIIMYTINLSLLIICLVLLAVCAALHYLLAKEKRRADDAIMMWRSATQENRRLMDEKMELVAENNRLREGAVE